VTCGLADSEADSRDIGTPASHCRALSPIGARAGADSESGPNPAGRRSQQRGPLAGFRVKLPVPRASGYRGAEGPITAATVTRDYDSADGSRVSGPGATWLDTT
jgi:hypothetical protein